MITIYEVIDSDRLDRQRGEDEVFVFETEAPSVSNTVTMGSDRLWQVVHSETYSSTTQSITLALVHPLGAFTPDRKEWEQTQWKENYPDIATNLQVMPDGQLKYGGMSMRGYPHMGRLEGGKATSHPTLLEPVPLPFVVEQVHTCYPDSATPCFTAVHICRYVESPLSAPTTDLAIA